MQGEAMPYSLKHRKSFGASAPDLLATPNSSFSDRSQPAAAAQQKVTEWLLRVVALLTACDESAGAVGLLLWLLKAHIGCATTPAGEGEAAGQSGWGAAGDAVLGMLSTLSET